MKKLLLFALTLTAISSETKAQFYLKAGAGYAFPQAGQLTNSFFGGFYSGNVSSSNFELKKASLTSGFQGVLGAGYFFNDNVGVELNAVITATPRNHEYVNSYSESGISYFQTTTTQAKTPVIINPSLVLRTSRKKLNLYARGGLALPVKTNIINEIESSASTGSGVLARSTAVYEQKNAFNLGFTGAMGLSLNIAPAVSIWLEGSLLSLSIYAKEAEMVEYTVDGENKLNEVNPWFRYLKFEKESPRVANSGIYSTFSMPYSNIGINFGIAFSF